MLAVFTGGFTLEAAHAVASDTVGDEFATLDVIDSLVLKSFVAVGSLDNRTRYSLLETIRAYALERLDATGEARAARDRHLAYFADYAVRSRTAFRAHGGASLIGALESERENFSAAAVHARDTGDGKRGIDIIASSRTFAREAPLDELLAWAEAFDATCDGDDRGRALLWNAVGTALDYRVMDADAPYERAVRHAQSAAAREEIVFAYQGLVLAKLRKREFDAAREYGCALEGIAVDGFTALLALNARAQLATFQGDRREAIALFTELAQGYRARGDVQSAARSLINVAEAAFARGEVARAIAVAEDALRDYAAAGLRPTPLLLSNLAAYHLAMGEIDRGIARARESLESGNGGDQDAFTLDHLALGYALSGDHEKAAIMHGCARAHIRGLAVVGDFTERTTHDRIAIELEQALAPQRRDELNARGAMLDISSFC